VYPPVDFSIEAPHVEAFARALGADPADGVPPTYAAVYALGTTARQLFDDPEAGVDFANLLHREQEFEWQRQPEVGETVTAQARVTSDVERRGIRFITLESSVTAGGAPFCSSRAVFVIGSSS
jgi:hypothetical protein